MKSVEDVETWAEVEKNREAVEDKNKLKKKKTSELSKKLESSQDITDSRENQLEDTDEISVQSKIIKLQILDRLRFWHHMKVVFKL